MRETVITFQVANFEKVVPIYKVLQKEKLIFFTHILIKNSEYNLPMEFIFRNTEDSHYAIESFNATIEKEIGGKIVGCHLENRGIDCSKVKLELLMRPTPEIQPLKNNWIEISYKTFNNDDDEDDDNYSIVPVYPTENLKNKLKVEDKVMEILST